MIAFLGDITERKQAEIALRESGLQVRRFGVVRRSPLGFSSDADLWAY
jgi:hypothetical protein